MTDFTSAFLECTEPKQVDLIVDRHILALAPYQRQHLIIMGNKSKRRIATQKNELELQDLI